MGEPIAGSWSISCSVWIAVCDALILGPISTATPGKSTCIPQCGMIGSTGWNERVMAAMAGPKIIKSLERGLTVLQALQMQPNSSLHELYIFTRISKPSLLRILYTLSRSGVVTRRLGDGCYRIGSNLSHTPSRREHRDRIAEAAAPILVRLCQRVSWPSDLMVPAGDHMEIRETSRTRSPILLQPRAHWIASRLAVDRGRAGLSRLLSRQRASTCDNHAALIVQI